MKSLVLIATLLTSFSVVAGLGPSSSWSDIMDNHNYVIDGPKVSFSNRLVSILDTCYIEATDQMRTAKKVMTYNRTSRGDRDIWTPAGKKHLYTNRVYERTICGGTGDRSFGPVLFSKIFNVPACN